MENGGYIGLTADAPIKLNQEVYRNLDMSVEIEKLVGIKFNHQLIIDVVGKKVNKGGTIVLVECLECGLFVERYIGHVKCMKSCNCGKSNLRKKFIRENKIWRCMRQRCDNPNELNYSIYGGRGITYCRQWKVFDNFILDMGPRPSEDHQIDRIDNDGNYEPSNCRWATRSENMRNTRRAKKVNYNGDLSHILDISEKEGIDRNVIYRRYKLGYRDERLWT
jgi:hypothetical protein